jgi:hypothetical protein
MTDPINILVKRDELTLEGKLILKSDLNKNKNYSLP